MSAATETIAFLANYNSWRRGDETIEMPSPAEIGATIDDAVNLLRKYDDLKARAERAEAELADERAKVRALRSACESICEEWGANNNSWPIGAGNKMEKRATAALAATEDAT